MESESKLEDALFRAALQLIGPERDIFLSGGCLGNPALLHRLEARLRAREGSATLPDAPAAPPERSTVRLEFAEVEGPGAKIGRYKLLQKIGEGGMGVVYMAEQEEPVRRRVALKIIKLGMDTRHVVARFEAERQALALMDHPNIARVLDGGATEAGRPYFVMELVQGIPITEFCDKNKFPARERLKIFIQVCQAVQSAHQKGIIHRDIKPSNVLVTLHHGTPMPKVIDFGVAKATSQKLTEMTLFTNYGAMIGTPAYMSPEQAEMSSMDIDTRSDIYSLGVLLYELLTGSTPFPEQRLRRLAFGEMQRVIAEEEPQRPSTRLSTLGDEEKTAVVKNRGEAFGALSNLLKGDLDWIVMKCLEKDRTRRYETANGLAADILRQMQNEPVVARPPSTVYRFQKAFRRHKLEFLAATTVAVALIAGIGLSSWQAIEAGRAWNAERAQRIAAQKAQKETEQSRQAEKQSRLRAEARETEARLLLYAARLNLAQRAWEQNKIRRLQQLLEETRESRDRGFEWFYWQRQTHLALQTFRGHLDSVNFAAFSPDRRRIVSGSSDQTAIIWDATSGKQLFTLKGHRAPIESAAFSPDGRRIVTGSADQTAKVWDPDSGSELLTLKGHSGGINSAAFSPDGRQIVTGSYDQTAKVWEAADGRELFTLKGHSGWVWSVAFSQDGRRIVTGSADHSARVWDAANGKELLAITGRSDEINSAAFSPDGRRIVTGSHDGTANVWDAVTGGELLILKGHSDQIWSVAFSPDGDRIVTGGADQTAKVWDAASGKELFTLKGHGGAIYSTAYSSDGKRIVTGSYDHTVKVWDAAGGGDLLPLQAHTDRIRAAAFSPEGRRIVTGSADYTAKVWDAANGKEPLTLNGHQDQIWSVGFSPDGRRVVTGSADQTAKVWDAANGRELLTLKGHTGTIYSTAFSPDGQRIVTGSDDGTAKVWEALGGTERFTIAGHSNAVWSVAFSPDGRRIVTGSADHTAKVWDAANGRELLTLDGHTAQILSVGFSPDGLRIVTGSADQTAKVWDALSGKELSTLIGHSDTIWAVGFSPDGRRIVTGSADRTAKVWDAASNQELLTLKGHSGRISSAAFSPDGRRLVTGSFDGTARVWEAASETQAADWREERGMDDQRLATRLDERAKELERGRLQRSQDAGAIRQWLILAPIGFSGGDSVGALNRQQIPNEAGLHPRVGEKLQLSGSQRIWRAARLDDYLIDFNQFLGDETVWSVAYAVAYIQSKVDRSRLVMMVGSDDQAKVYLNGRQLYQCAKSRAYVADQDTVAGVELKAGVNVVVFKVVNESLHWMGSLRFTDAAGQPVKGIEVTLDPEGKNFP